MKRTSNFCRDSRGFTLVELLVVTSIMAILAAIAFPVFSHVRSSMREGHCLQNLHQVGKAIHLYAGSYDDGLPWAPNEAHVFYAKLSGRPLTEFESGPTVKTVLMPFLREESVFRSPSDDAFTGFAEAEGPFLDRVPPGFYERMGSSYRIRHSGSDAVRFLSRVENPGKRFLAASVFAFHGTPEAPRFSLLTFDMSACLRPWSQYTLYLSTE